MKRFMMTSVAAALAVALAAGCKDEPEPVATPPAQGGNVGGTPAPGEPKTHEHAEGEEHDEHPGGEEHPNRVELGSKTVAGLTLKATQDEPVKAGGEGAFNLAITGGKPKAVRFWVGAGSAEGSVKAKAEEETPGNWHTHIEVPDPLPAGSQFWAEIEPATGEKFTVSFDLKN